jgi:hypothetical protein
MFLRRVRAIRLAAVYLLFTVALLMVPKADNPETPFDECNTQTNEMVVVRAAPSREYRPPATTFGLSILVQPWRISVRRVLPVFVGRFTDSRVFRETLLC